MARFISGKLLALALGAVVFGGGFFATAGTVSADGPDDGGYHDWDNNHWDDDKWDDNKWDNDKWNSHHNDCDDHGWSGDYWSAHWDEDWDGHGQPWNENDKGNWNGGWDKNDWEWWKNHNDDCDDDDDHHVIYIYVGPSSYVHYPITGPEFGRYSNGLAGLIQDASMVFGITEQALYEKLYTGRTLVSIAIDYQIGEANLQELLLALNPDLAPNIYAIVWQPWLLTSTIWIPQ
jgi:hypothetical protein